MRKLTNRELIDRCNSLTAQLHRVNEENKRLKEELERCSFNENKVSTEKPCSVVRELPVSKAEEYSEKPSEEPKAETVGNSKLPDELKIGAAAIGKLVISSAVFANKLTPGGKADNKELVNLILGRTEAAKLKIFEIAVSDCELSEKSGEMEKCFAETEEYFKEIVRRYGECENENM